VNNPRTIERDFKSTSFEHKKKRQRKRRPLVIGSISLSIAAAVVVLALTVTTTSKASLSSNQLVISDKVNPVSIHSTLSLPETEPGRINSPEPATNLQAGKLQQVTIRRGDSLSMAFDRIGLPPSQIQAVMELGKNSKVLTRLHPGDQLKIYTSQDGSQLRGLIYHIDENHRLEIAMGSEGLNSQIIESPIETRISHATGTIDSSLFLAAQQSGLSDNLTMELANLFGWDIDFALDIRAGDQFSLVYEEQYLHGKKLHDGNILAAEFINQDHSYRAIRFTDDEGHSGYYTPDGKSVRKAFLRTPVDFKRISSRFSLHRKHPKLNTIRAHKGVDYAAARGTPIRATGDGKVIYRGVKGGYGNVVILQHGTSYSTLYGHMSRFARGIYSGRQVHQGQIIGYVGMTGLATGPHLHYEFRVNGVHRNPLTVHLPDAAPLPKQYRAAFDMTSQPLLAQLDTLKRTMLALNSQ